MKLFHTKFIRITAALAALILMSTTIQSCADIGREPEETLVNITYQTDVLEAAVSGSHKLTRVETSEAGVTLHFKDGFSVNGRDITELYIPKKGYKSVNEDDSTFRIELASGEAYVLWFNNGLAVKFDPNIAPPAVPEDFYGDMPNNIGQYAMVYVYVNELTEIPFTVTENDRGVLNIKVACNNKVPVEVEYNPETRQGKLSFTIEDQYYLDPYWTITFSDGHNTYARFIKVRPAWMEVRINEKQSTSTDFVVHGEIGERLDLSGIVYDVYTNLPERLKPEVQFFTDEDWLAIEGDEAVITSLNPTKEDRTGYVLIQDSGRHMEPCKIPVVQWPAPPAVVEGCVAFNDWNLKDALLPIADQDNDGEISYEEALLVKEINVSGKGIRDLKGIGAFKKAEIFDAHNNDIVDGSEITEMRMLHILNLLENPHLKTFDVRGCCRYFEDCFFDMTSMEAYYCNGHQGEIFLPCDENETKIVCTPDMRETEDWSNHNKVIKFKEHTKGDGNKAICFGSRGWLDIDVEDTSFERFLMHAVNLALETFPCLHDWQEYFDFYYIITLRENRHRWEGDEYWVRRGYSEIKPELKEQVYRENWNEFYDLVFTAYETIFPNINGEMLSLTVNASVNPQQCCGFFVFDGPLNHMSKLSNYTHPRLYEMMPHIYCADYCAIQSNYLMPAYPWKVSDTVTMLYSQTAKFINDLFGTSYPLDPREVGI